jgi:hypothetical protein
MHPRRIALVLVICLLAAAPAEAQSTPAAPKPISLQGLMEALRIGGLTTQELIDIVNQRGVVFQVTEQVETDMRAAGAQTTLIEAVRAAYRPPVPEPKPPRLAPLAKNEVLTLLEVGTPAARIEQIVTQRGVSFALTPAAAAELSSAGAEAALLSAIETAAAKSSAVPAPAAPAAAPPAAAPSPAPVRLASLKEVQTLYIEKMKNNLDRYLRAELSKQLPGRFTVVLNKDDAHALLVGTGEQSSGTTAAVAGRLGLHDTARGAVSIVDKAGTVLWASEAGDRTLLFGALKRGGTAKVAARLVQDLKKALDAVE